MAQSPCQSSYASCENNRGRGELRIVSTWAGSAALLPRGWGSIKELVQVERVVWKKGVKAEHRHYYVSSLQANACYYGEAIRSHWAIENGLHWVKDVTFGEDRSAIGTANAPLNMSAMRNLAINLFRAENKAVNLASAKRTIAGNIKKLKQLVT